MSTDSTELTFVRCPSCRSLVPAAQTRCRMCGASLDASGAEEPGNAGKRSGRVKQRTMSTPDSKISEMVDQIKAKPEPVHAETKVVEEEPEEVVSGLPSDDPLGPYIEEVNLDDEEESEVVFAESEETALNGKHYQEDATRKVTLESGRSRSGGLSFGKNREEVPGKADSLSDEVEEKDEKGWAAVDSQSDVSNRTSHGSVSGRTTSASGELQEIANRLRKEESEDEQLEEDAVQEKPSEKRVKEELPSKQPFDAAKKGASPQGGVRGRLFGWLVSYSDPDGMAVELREGKFFVSSSSLKSHDLVIDDPSVSTPHALCSIGLEDGFRIQDLMSDRGVFVRRRSGDTYQREELCRVEHGDWVRFGDIEYLVSLIAHVGEK
ncbi:MAG: FHA domain-containing protein [Bdellovibrionales bacterium]|nr:FHA domain-containing protein [Bdellovibrionales bacterium]